MTKFLKWMYLTDSGLMTQCALVGTILSIFCVISNQKFDINAAYWATLPLLAVWHFAAKRQEQKKGLAFVRTFN